MTAATFAIRDMEARDLKDLLRLVEALAMHHGEASELTETQLQQMIFAEGSALRVLVAEEAGQLLGYVALYPYYRLQLGFSGMDLHHFYVVPEQRGSGIGSALIEAAKAHARSCGAAYLLATADPENAAVRATYLHMGFEELPAFGVKYRIGVA